VGVEGWGEVRGETLDRDDKATEKVWLELGGRGMLKVLQKPKEESGWGKEEEGGGRVMGRVTVVLGIRLCGRRGLW